MEFSGQTLISILEQQWPECRVELAMPGFERGETMPPAEAAKMVAELAAGGSGFIDCLEGCCHTYVSAGALVGVGHHKRIMYLKPCDLGMWRGRKTTERVRNENGEYIGTPLTVKHVGEKVSHGSPDPEWMRQVSPHAVKTQLAFRPHRDVADTVFRQLPGDPKLKEAKFGKSKLGD